MADAAPLMGLREYARHRKAAGLAGYSLSTVQRAIEDGRIPYIERKGRKLINAAEADAAWKANTRHRSDRHGDEAGDAPAKSPAEEKARGGPPPGSPAALKAEETALKIERQKLELAEKRGELVKRADVRRELFDLVRRARDRILNVPGRIAAQAAAEVEERKVEQVISAELRVALEEISEEAKLAIKEATDDKGTA